MYCRCLPYRHRHVGEPAQVNVLTQPVRPAVSVAPESEFVDAEAYNDELAKAAGATMTAPDLHGPDVAPQNSTAEAD